MAFNPLKIFSKQDMQKNTTDKNDEGPSILIPSSQKTPSAKGQKRDSHGRFIKKSTQTPQEKEKKGHPTPSGKHPEGPYTLTFYSKPIRRFYRNSTWYFSIEDVLSCSTEYSAYVDYLNDPKDKNPKEVQKIKFRPPEAKGEVECTDAAGIIVLIRSAEKSFPGPIVDWILDVSKRSIENDIEMLKSASS